MYYVYALESLLEKRIYVQSHLYDKRWNQEYILDADFQAAYNQAKKTKGLINGFISYLKGKK